MKAAVTFDEEEQLPVLVLTTEKPDEDRLIALVAAFNDFKIMVQMDAGELLVFERNCDA